jgi:hypothetical protein
MGDVETGLLDWRVVMKALASVLLLALIAAVIFLPRVPTGNASEPSRSVWVNDTSFAVMNNGITAYRVDGVNNPTLAIYRGQRVTFNVSAVGHPFYIKTLRTTGVTNLYPDGVTGQGETLGPVEFIVPSNAPNQLFYQCGVHAVMGGTLNIQDPLGVPQGHGPEAVQLGPAAPNPARGNATFSYSLPRTMRVYFALFDARGRRVRTITDGVEPAGQHLVPWDGRDDRGRTAPNGLYFFKLRADGRALSGQLVMAR